MNRSRRVTSRILVPATMAVALLLVACHKNPVRPAISTPLPPQPVSTEPPPVPVPDTWPELPLPPSRLPAPPQPPLPKNFREGETSFQNSKYEEAVRAYERFIREDPITQFKDEAMFKLAMAHGLACSAPECRARSVEQFKRLVSQYPESPYSAEARFILAMQSDIDRMKADTKTRDEKIKKLNEELEKLKQIDLERRPPAIEKKIKK